MPTKSANMQTYRSPTRGVAVSLFSIVDALLDVVSYRVRQFGLTWPSRHAVAARGRATSSPRRTRAWLPSPPRTATPGKKNVVPTITRAGLPLIPFVTSAGVSNRSGAHTSTLTDLCSDLRHCDAGIESRDAGKPKTLTGRCP